MRLKLLVIFSVLVTTNAQRFLSGINPHSDESFKKMCSFWDGEGTYKEKAKGPNPPSGDTCSFHFPVETDDEDSARRYCEENVPFHIHGVTPGRPTVCNAEATLACKKGWVQMFGRCYRMVKKLVTRETAESFCQNLGATIAFMHREALPFRLNDYFTHVPRVWIDASEAITNNLLYDKPDGYLLLAFDGYKYNLPNIALARVNRSETAMILCEYTPLMNLAESNYLLRRYGDVYYPTIFTEKTSYVRTASNLQRNDANRMGDNNYCKKVLRPFLQSDNAQSAVPTREFLDQLTKHREATIIRTSVYSGDARKDSRSNKECTPSNATNYGTDYPGINGKPLFVNLKNDKSIWRENEPNEMCDGATWSTGIVLSRDKDKGLEAMSDARYAPIYCQTSFEVMEYGDCPKGWTEFIREERGQKWCHKFEGEKLLTWFNAQRACRKMGARLTGFTNQKELDLLDDLLTKSGKEFFRRNTWLGARRREICLDLKNKDYNGGFHPDPTHGCSRSRVFEWVQGVASNPPDFVDLKNPKIHRYADDDEPNLSGMERCIELLKGRQPQWQWNGADVTKKLNDIKCQEEKYYICGKEAPIVPKK